MTFAGQEFQLIAILSPMSDELKSAVELALERLDSEQGRAPSLTEEQKERIADIRSRYRARIAQEEIHLQTEIAKLMETGDATALQTTTDNVRAEKRRLEEKMDREVAKVHEEPA